MAEIPPVHIYTDMGSCKDIGQAKQETRQAKCEAGRRITAQRRQASTASPRRARIGGTTNSVGGDKFLSGLSFNLFDKARLFRYSYMRKHRAKTAC